MNKRLLFSTFVAIGMAGCVTAPTPPRLANPTAPVPPVDKHFWWGTSTSSFQNEDEGLSKTSPYYFKTDWDVFADEGHAPHRGDASSSWTRFDADLAAVKLLGVNHFRFSIEWARVEPRPGVYDEAAIRQYVRMARELRAAGIEPIVTLWHFTFPSWLYDKNDKSAVNFLNPQARPHWNAFVRRMVRELKPYVRAYVPQNEPNGAVQLGYLGGHWPPGLLLRPYSYKHALQASADMFRDAANIIHQERPDAWVIGIYSVPNWKRNFLLDPTGMTYNTMMRQNFDHLDKVYDTVDVIGVNYYYTQDAAISAFLNHGQGEVGSRYTQMGWQIVPEGLYDVLQTVFKRYRKPLIISENGLGTQSEQKKIRYFRDHINQMRRAMADGVTVQGYFAWTLVDNFEWTEGYTANFGLTHFDPKTKVRILGPSALWYRDFIRSHPMP
ncbi:MAG: family 1 glycosylhydrolase [Chthoniobacterales bacterium]